MRSAGLRKFEVRVDAHVVASHAFELLADRSPLALSVYLLLTAYAGAGDDSAPDLSWASHRHIARSLGIWRKDVYRALELLKDLGWISLHKERRDAHGYRQANQYRLHLPGDARVADRQVNEDLAAAPDSARWQTSIRATDRLELRPAAERWIFVDANGSRQVKRAILPLSVLTSMTWSSIRTSGVAQRLWLLVDACSSGGRAPETRRVADWAEDLGCSVRAVRECQKRLESATLLAITPCSGTRNTYAPACPDVLQHVGCPDPSCKDPPAAIPLHPVARPASQAASGAPQVDAGKPGATGPPPDSAIEEQLDDVDGAELRAARGGAAGQSGATPRADLGDTSAVTADYSSDPALAAFWPACLAALELRIGAADMDAWVRSDLSVVAIDAGDVVLLASSTWHQDWICANILVDVVQVCRELLGADVQVRVDCPADVAGNAARTPVSADAIALEWWKVWADAAGGVKRTWSAVEQQLVEDQVNEHGAAAIDVLRQALALLDGRGRRKMQSPRMIESSLSKFRRSA